MLQLLGDSVPRPPTGASPLDPTGGLPSPDPLICPPPQLHLLDWPLKPYLLDCLIFFHKQSMLYCDVVITGVCLKFLGLAGGGRAGVEVVARLG